MQLYANRARLLHAIPGTLSSLGYRAAEQNTLSLLQFCKSLLHLHQIQARIIKHGLLSNPLVLTKFTSTSSDIDAIDHAFVFLFPSEANVQAYDAFLFNTVIRAYAQTRESKRNAVSAYCFMVGNGVFPNKFTYPFVLKACAGIGDFRLGQQLHGSLLKFGFEWDLHVGNTMVHMYGSCRGGVDSARKVFDEMPERNSVTWSAVIGAYVKSGQSYDAVELFRRMQVARVLPDEVTMVSVLSACTDLGALELGKWVQSYVERERVHRSVELSNSLINMFVKCGDVEKALEVFRRMDKRDIVSWTSLLVGLGMHGQGVEAISFFEEMKGARIAPDSVAFIGLLNACSHAGLVDKGRLYFDLMKKEFGISPKIEHYGCMVDLFCRAGLVKEALEFVENLPIEPNPVIMRTLINSCGGQGDQLKLSEKITERLIGSEPMHDSNYVILSNIYAKMSLWEKKNSIREIMERKGIKKIPGTTMIELDNEIHEFIAGDRTHNQYKEIYEMLIDMVKQMTKAGYKPVISEVLLDIDEEDKEDALTWHSEKLAIAFAILRTPPGSPIRIVKNMRVCTDCHTATKFISKIYNRSILVRDRTRFHHFKDGICSCKDFW